MIGKPCTEFLIGLGKTVVVIPAPFFIHFIDLSCSTGIGDLSVFTSAHTFFKKADDRVILHPILFPCRRYSYVLLADGFDAGDGPLGHQFKITNCMNGGSGMKYRIFYGTEPKFSDRDLQDFSVYHFPLCLQAPWNKA